MNSLCRMPSASSEPTGVERPGTLILGAEHLFGLAVTTSTVKSKDADPPITTESTQSQFGLFVSNATSALSVPRLALDYNVALNVTIGGAFGYASTSSETTTELGGVKASGDGPTSTAVLFAPRVGYLTMSGTVGFWGKVGFSYFSATDKSTSTSSSGSTTITNETTATGFSAAIEPTLMIAPIDHVMLSIGLNLNLPLSGSVTAKQSGGATSSSVEYESKLTSYGATAGLHAWF